MSRIIRKGAFTAYANSKDSDQTAQMRSLISLFCSHERSKNP